MNRNIYTRKGEIHNHRLCELPDGEEMVCPWGVLDRLGSSLLRNFPFLFLGVGFFPVWKIQVSQIEYKLQLLKIHCDENFL